MARKLMLPLAATLFLASTAAGAAAAPAPAVPGAPVYAAVTIEEKGEGCQQYTTETTGLSVELCQGPWIGEDGQEIVEDREGEPYRWIVGQVTNHNRAMGVCALAFDLGKAETAPGFVMDPTSLPLSSDKGKARRGGKERKKEGAWGELGPESLWTFSVLVPAEGGARVGLTTKTMVVCEVEKRVEEEEEEEEEERRPVHDEEEEEEEEENEKGGGGVEVDYVEKGGAEEDEEEGGVQDHDGGAVAYDEEMNKVAVSEEGREEGVVVEEDETKHAHRKHERAARRQHRHPEGEGEEGGSLLLASSAPASTTAAAAGAGAAGGGGEGEGLTVIHSGAASAWPGKMTSLVVCLALGVVAGMVA